MDIIINGRKYTVPKPMRLSQLIKNIKEDSTVKYISFEQQRYIFLLNGKIISPDQYDRTMVCEKDSVKIIFQLIGG